MMANPTDGALYGANKEPFDAKGLHVCLHGFLCGLRDSAHTNDNGQQTEHAEESGDHRVSSGASGFLGTNPGTTDNLN
jgi:hypothetical protein